jgi:hypothetical protein
MLAEITQTFGQVAGELGALQGAFVAEMAQARVADVLGRFDVGLL